MKFLSGKCLYKIKLTVIAIVVCLSVQISLTVDAFAEVGVNAGASKVMKADSVSVDEVKTEEPERVIEIKVTVNEVSENVVGNIVMAGVEESLNVRAQATEDSELVGKLYSNSCGEIIEKNADWTKLKSGNLIGWAKNDFLIFGEEAEKLAAEATSVTAKIKTDSLRVRKEANEEAGVYGLVGKGDTFDVIEESGDWIKIQFSKDIAGYIALEYADLTRETPYGETIEEINTRETAEKEAAAKKAQELAASRTTATTATNNGAITGDVNDVLLLAALIQCEAGSECYEGQVAVGSVVMNRLRGGRYGNSLYTVIYASGQFSPAGSGRVATVYARGPKAVCIQAAQDAMNGISLVGTATHFRNIRSGFAGIVIGNHVFW